MSTLCSAAIFRTSGVDFVRRRCSAVCTPPPSPSTGRPDDRLHGYGLPLLHFDLRQDAGGRRRDFGVDLVGRDLEQRLVPLDGIADLLEPFAERPLRN